MSKSCSWRNSLTQMVYKKKSSLSLSSTPQLPVIYVIISKHIVFIVTVRNLPFLFRSLRPEVFCKKGVLRNFTKFTGKRLCQSLFFNKVAGLRLQDWDSGTGVFLWILSNIQEHLFLPNTSGGCFLLEQGHIKHYFTSQKSDIYFVRGILVNDWCKCK